MAQISYEIDLDGLTTIDVKSTGESQRVQLVLWRQGEDVLHVDMHYLNAERFWHAIKGCVDYSSKKGE